MAATPRRGENSVSDETDFMRLQEFEQQYPGLSRLGGLAGKSPIVPAKRTDKGNLKIVEHARWYISPDNEMFVVRHVDTYRRIPTSGEFSRDQIITEAASIRYRGKSARGAVDAMNVELAELDGSGWPEQRAEPVSFQEPVPRPPTPYQIGELAVHLGKRLNPPARMYESNAGLERVKPILDQFGLEI